MCYSGWAIYRSMKIILCFLSYLALVDSLSPTPKGNLYLFTFFLNIVYKSCTFFVGWLKDENLFMIYKHVLKDLLARMKQVYY